jgi:hypothetical protein
VRELKDAMSHDLLAAFDEAGIGIASATFEIAGLPPLRQKRFPGESRAADSAARRRSRVTPNEGFNLTSVLKED